MNNDQLNRNSQLIYSQPINSNFFLSTWKEYSHDNIWLTTLTTYILTKIKNGIKENIVEEFNVSVIQMLYHRFINPIAYVNAAFIFSIKSVHSLNEVEIKDCIFPILPDGSTIIDPFDFDQLLPAFDTLETLYPGTQKKNLIIEASSTRNIESGFRLKHYIPSFISWIGNVYIRNNNYFKWNIENNILGLENNDEIDELYSIELDDQYGFWHASNNSTQLSILHSNNICKILISSSSIQKVYIKPLILNSTKFPNIIYNSTHDINVDSKGYYISGSEIQLTYCHHKSDNCLLSKLKRGRFFDYGQKIIVLISNSTCTLIDNEQLIFKSQINLNNQDIYSLENTFQNNSFYFGENISTSLSNIISRRVTQYYGKHIFGNIKKSLTIPYFKSNIGFLSSNEYPDLESL